MSCVEALDWLPGCDWPIWLQLASGYAVFLVLLIGSRRWQRR